MVISKVGKVKIPTHALMLKDGVIEADQEIEVASINSDEESNTSEAVALTVACADPNTNMSQIMNSSVLLLKYSTKDRSGIVEHLYNLVISTYIQNRKLFKDITAEDLVSDNITYIFGEYFHLFFKYPIPKQ